ncbi:hypothetical protein GCM10023091_36660 [Ravibacter arvi]|uniref:Cyclophilin-like domain-containing protein n=1 Tax=Ravibacter arvi TaxID=2051041 RepID=A0ABP8M8P1_9BACT
MRQLLYVLVIALGFAPVYGCSMNKDLPDPQEEDNHPQKANMKLKISVGGKTATAILYDNPTSRDFVTLLPLTVKMDDYAGTEKIFYPARKLSSQGAPAGFNPSAGDLTLYAPWGNIALFYKDFGYSAGLISLGRITSGIEAFAVKGAVTVKMELEP